MAKDDSILIQSNNDENPKTVHVENMNAIKNKYGLEGYDSKGKEAMLATLTDAEQRLISEHVRNHIFLRIKFLSLDKLGNDSSIIEKLFNHIQVTNENDKKHKFLGVRFLLQRQMNSTKLCCRKNNEKHERYEIVNLILT